MVTFEPAEDRRRDPHHCYNAQDARSGSCLTSEPPSRACYRGRGKLVGRGLAATALGYAHNHEEAFWTSTTASYVAGIHRGSMVLTEQIRKVG